MKIWVDTPSGTWGCIEDLLFIEVPQDELDEMADMTDFGRSEWAVNHSTAQKLINSDEVFTDYKP